MTFQLHDLQRILEVLHWSENLKNITRHSWLSSGRQESVAEHSWRLGFMALLLAPYYERSLDLTRCLKLALVHDLAEAETGDIPAFYVHDKQQKLALEEAAIRKIANLLNDTTGQELVELWHEYNQCQTDEAKFIKALDKLEVFIQHNEASLSTWLPNEKQMVFEKRWHENYCLHSPLLINLLQLILNESINKFKKESIDINAIVNQVEDKERTTILTDIINHSV